MRYIRGIWILLLFVSGLMSCSQQPEAGKDRYVVLSPELAEIISALGATESIVGITAECSYPPQLLDKKIVGNFGAIKVEEVLKLNPEIVFTSALEQEAIAYDLQKLGIRVVSSYPKSLAELQSEIIRIGEIIGRQAAAAALADSLRTRIQGIQAAAANLPQPKVYLEIYRDPLMSVADDSFVGKLIETAGGDNIFSSLERDYARVKAEEIISAAPDIIICFSRDTIPNIRARKGWGDIPAIRNAMIFTEADIHPDLIQRAGPRSIDGMLRLQEIYQLWRSKTQ
ncbi:MAG: cobalamin transport system substrate-binding protein [Candidatus Cloacimonadota bacterium]|nr:cobalamin transport system substrate-binding protein [Candidatus Cloacimonadota bacterium]